MRSVVELGGAMVCLIASLAAFVLIGGRYAFNVFSNRMVALQCLSLFLGVGLAGWLVNDAILPALSPGWLALVILLPGVFTAAFWWAGAMASRRSVVRMLRQGQVLSSGISPETVAAAREHLNSSLQ